MHHDHHVTASGEVTEVFAHRFVVRTDQGSILADLGPGGAGQVTLAPGDRVELSGTRKPSELKVSRLTLGGRTVEIAHGKQERPDGRHAPAPDDRGATDPAAALAAVADKGWQVVAAPRRKPKHFEILARDPTGSLAEFHVGLGGDIRNSKPVHAVGGRWGGLSVP